MSNKTISINPALFSIKKNKTKKKKKNKKNQINLIKKKNKQKKKKKLSQKYNHLSRQTC